MNPKKTTIALAAKVIAALGFTLLFILNLTAVVEKDSKTGNLSVVQLQASAQNEVPPQNPAEVVQHYWSYSSTSTFAYFDKDRYITCKRDRYVDDVYCYGYGSQDCTPNGNTSYGDAYDCN